MIRRFLNWLRPPQVDFSIHQHDLVIREMGVSKPFTGPIMLPVPEEDGLVFPADRHAELNAAVRNVHLAREAPLRALRTEVPDSGEVKSASSSVSNGLTGVPIDDFSTIRDRLAENVDTLRQDGEAIAPAVSHALVKRIARDPDLAGRIVTTRSIVDEASRRAETWLRSQREKEVNVYVNARAKTDGTATMNIVLTRMGKRKDFAYEPDMGDNAFGAAMGDAVAKLPPPHVFPEEMDAAEFIDAMDYDIIRGLGKGAP